MESQLDETDQPGMADDEPLYLAAAHVGPVRIIVGVRSMRPSIMHDRPNDVSPRSTSAAILLLNKACVYLCILSNGHSTMVSETSDNRWRGTQRW